MATPDHSGPPAERLVLIRHAPVARAGLAGRSDPEAASVPPAHAAALRARLDPAARVIASPARRAQSTASIFGRWDTDPRLWEQDFGDWEGRAELPDLGPLDRAALADHRPPGGETFREMAARVAPVLRGDGSRILVAHAGTVRAALGLALGDVALGLAFSVAPLSLTEILWTDAGAAVLAVNWQW